LRNKRGAEESISLSSFSFRSLHGLDPLVDRGTELLTAVSDPDTIHPKVTGAFWIRLIEMLRRMSVIPMFFTVVITREEEHYVALAPDVDIASQGSSIEDALTNLREALELYFEDEDAVRPPQTDKPIITLVEVSP
jgi:predicted RNase H-like HicB family nuclease